MHPIVFVILMVLTAANLAFASALTEKSLYFNPVAGQTSSRTFSFQPGTAALGVVSVVRFDLAGTNLSSVITAEDVLVEPLNFPVVDTNKLPTFRVTIKGPAKAGNYQGRLEVRYFSPHTAGKIETATLALECQTHLVPAIEAEAGSKKLSINATLPAFFAPNLTSPVEKASIQLVQNADSPARIINAYVTALGIAGRQVPTNAVTILTPQPMSIPGRGIYRLDLQVDPSELRAGEYNGTVYVNVLNQPAMANIPFQLKIKDHWFLPVVALSVGLLAAALFKWWNTEGKELSELLEKILSRISSLPTLEKIQMADRELIQARLNEALKSIDLGRPVEEVKEREEKARLAINFAVAETEKLLLRLAEQKAQIRDIKNCERFNQALMNKLEDFEEKLISGNYPSIAVAGTGVPAIEAEVMNAKSACLEWSNLTKEKQDEFRPKWDLATTAAELSAVVREAQGLIGVAESVGILEFPDESVVSQLDNLRFKNRRKLVLGKFILSVLVWCLIFWIGYNTLYEDVPTFGASFRDYLTLFFWGATLEALRGQAITLTGLRTVLKI